MKKTILLSLLFASGVAKAYDPPTMGWSSWNTFALNINEATIKQTALSMKTKGYAAAGYIYCNIDDGYFGGRDAETGHLLIHPTRFPNGLQPVVDYIHKQGLKAGIYSDGGEDTCGSYHGGDKDGVGVGLYGHDQQDCDFFFKELGFDFIKVDFCGGVSYHNKDGRNLSEKERYTAIHKAIENTGRDDVRMNICRWDYPGAWAKDISCSWRMHGDINCSWGSVKEIIEDNLYLSAYCREGHYNDMDMLEVGRWLSAEEDKTHFGMWCLMSSPLLIGCNINDINSTAANLLKNKDLIAVNQDSLGLQAYVAKRNIEDNTYVLVKDVEQLNGLTRVVGLYNPNDAATEVSFDFNDLCMGGQVKMRDLFKKSNKSGTYEGTYTEKIPAHGLRIYKLTAEERLEQTCYEAEAAYMQTYQEIAWRGDTDARFEENAACSGGIVCTWLGKSPKNDIVWENVWSKEGGDYTLSIKCLSGESRRMSVQVNDGTSKSVTASNKGWNTVQNCSTKITLQPGQNKIRLYNSSAYMPNVDCIELKKTVPTAIEGIGTSADNAADTGTTLYQLHGTKASASMRGIVVRQGKKIIINK